MSAAHSVFKQCSECPPAAATHGQNLLRNDTIALSLNSCGKSFHIINKAVFILAVLVGFGVYL